MCVLEVVGREALEAEQGEALGGEEEGGRDGRLQHVPHRVLQHHLQ